MFWIYKSDFLFNKILQIVFWIYLYNIYGRFNLFKSSSNSVVTPLGMWVKAKVCGGGEGGVLYIR